MIEQTLIPLAGGGLLGFVAGYALKKIAKLLIIGIGALVLLLGYLSFERWISVNWVVVENQTQSIMTQAAHKAYAITQTMGHSIPIGVGLGAIAFIPGLLAGFAKG